MFTCAGVWLIGVSVAQAVFAGPVYQPSGANLTYGDVTHGQTLFSTGGNPAAAAALADREPGAYRVHSGLSVSAGVEYGNVQDIFDLIDEASKAFAPDPVEPPTSGGTPTPPIETRPPLDIGKIIDENFPDLAARVDKVVEEVAFHTGLLAIIASEGFGKAYVAGEVPIVGGRELLGGSWNINLNWSGTSKLRGIGRPIEFDADKFLDRLEEVLNNLPNVPTVYDIPGDVDLIVDPVKERLGIQFTNDSLVLTKAAKTTELSLGYGREVFASDHGKLFLGVDLKYVHMELSRVSVRFGDLTDSEELFEEIRNASFESDDNGTFDVGALWVGRNYQVGASLININEPNFHFPRGDLSSFTDPIVLRELSKDRKITLERQGKLEAAVFDENRKWSINVGYDTNPIVDQMGDEFQWATVSAGYATGSWWIPGLRLGYRQNLAGTKLKYASIGLTLFKYLNLDVASAFDTVKINGQDLPQGLMFNLGAGFKF
jgi:hypothetical protein